MDNMLQFCVKKTGPSVEEETTNEADNERLNLTKLIKVYFDFMYYLCMSPVRFERHNESSHYAAKGWLPQKIFTGLLNVLSIFHYISLFRSSFLFFDNLLEKHPKNYFNVFHPVANAAHKIILIKIMWFHWEKYLQVLNFILTERHLSTRKTGLMSNTYFAFLLCGASLIVTAMLIVMGNGLIKNSALWSPSWWLRRLASSARVIFGFDSPIKSETEAPEISELTHLDWILTFLMLLAHIRRMCLGVFADIGILVSVLTLYRATSYFSFRIDQILKSRENGMLLRSSGETKNWHWIYGSFLAIENLSDKVNNALGSLVTGFIAESLMFYSANLSISLLSRDIYQIFAFVVQFIVVFICMKASADIENHMSIVKRWLRINQNRKGVPFEEENFVLHEISANEIGLKPSFMFTITYNFLGGVT